MTESRRSSSAGRRSLLALAALPARVAGSGMDQVRVLTGVDAAVARFGVTGRGVIVALLDRGIDWKNADFRNADGTTRIAYIFDLTDDTGAARRRQPLRHGDASTRGSRSTRRSDRRAPLATRDAVGHGTTTAGIAAGNGSNTPRKYRGVATEATIIAVKVTSDGVPGARRRAGRGSLLRPRADLRGASTSCATRRTSSDSRP